MPWWATGRGNAPSDAGEYNALDLSHGCVTVEHSVAQFANRILRASKLDPRLYTEVKADTGAMGQALGTVLLASLAAGVGSVVHGWLTGLVLWTVVALVGWYIWASLTYILGAKLLPMPQTTAGHGAFLRTLGFASAPGLLRVLGVMPGLAGVGLLIAAVWMLVATVLAVRQALDYTSMLRALAVCLPGGLVQGLLMLLLVLLFGGG